MRYFTSLLEKLIGESQAGGVTMSVEIFMVSPTHCGKITRYSTCGGDATVIKFDPPMRLDKALVEAQEYTQKGHFVHPGAQ
jgi:hypothetical protein